MPAVIAGEHLEMIQFAVSAEKQRLLYERMSQLGVSESEFMEKFIRSSGSGGQHVNKTSTAVHLVHLPTGLEVKCMRERSQSLNRFLARRELLEKIAGQRGLATDGDRAAERIRRQKARAKRRRTASRKENE
jgi:protein subunit release factor B